MSLNRIWQLTARKLTRDITLEELQELEQLLRAHPELVSQLKLHSHYFKSGNYNGETPESAEAWQRQLKKLNENFPENFHVDNQRPKKKQVKMAIAMVAIFIFFGVVAGATYTFWKPNKKIETAKTIITKKTNTNLHWIMLPDGSRVKLNKKSHISLSKNFGKSNRSVSLEGEAFFDVAHDSKKPFVVEVGSIRVKVLGTSFNVRAYLDEGKVQTSLFRGSVEITDKAHKNLKVLLKPNEKLTIPIRAITSKLAEDFPYKIENLQKEELSGIIPEMAWVEHKLVFNSDPLSEVAVKLGKWHNINIIIEDPSLKEERFSAIFEKESINDALNALKTSYPFQFRKEEDGTIIIYK